MFSSYNHVFTGKDDEDNAIDRACAVYCEGPLLNAVQLAQLFNDSKTFVDMPMKLDPEPILEAFSKLADPHNRSALEQFVSDFFLPAGQDLEEWIPTDYSEEPDFINYISDPDYRTWA